MVEGSRVTIRQCGHEVASGITDKDLQPTDSETQRQQRAEQPACLSLSACAQERAPKTVKALGEGGKTRVGSPAP